VKEEDGLLVVILWFVGEGGERLDCCVYVLLVSGVGE
jgi:hypothetical protein